MATKNRRKTSLQKRAIKVPLFYFHFVLSFFLAEREKKEERKKKERKKERGKKEERKRKERRKKKEREFTMGKKTTTTLTKLSVC